MTTPKKPYNYTAAHWIPRLRKAKLNGHDKKYVTLISEMAEYAIARNKINEFESNLKETGTNRDFAVFRRTVNSLQEKKVTPVAPAAHVIHGVVADAAPTKDKSPYPHPPLFWLNQLTGHEYSSPGYQTVIEKMAAYAVDHHIVQHYAAGLRCANLMQGVRSFMGAVSKLRSMPIESRTLGFSYWKRMLAETPSRAGQEAILRDMAEHAVKENLVDDYGTTFSSHGWGDTRKQFYRAVASLADAPPTTTTPAPTTPPENLLEDVLMLIGFKNSRTDGNEYEFPTITGQIIRASRRTYHGGIVVFHLKYGKSVSDIVTTPMELVLTMMRLAVHNDRCRIAEKVGEVLDKEV